jgi:hypothetical protein
VSAFIGIEAIVPIQDSLGDGWCYTFFAIVLYIAGFMTLAVMRWGGQWRTKAEERDENKERKRKMEFGSSATTAVETPMVVHGSVSVARSGSPVEEAQH